MKIEDFRLEFPVTEEYIYLDNAAVGPIPKRVLDAVFETCAEKCYGELHWQDWEALVEDVRKMIASLINGYAEEIALTPNTSEGISIVANGIEWKKGENIVTTDMEFPSNLIPWQVQAKKYNIQLRIVPSKNGRLHMEDFEKLIDEKTRIVAVSHIQFSNGLKMNLKELSKLAHEKGAYLVTDAVQSIGQMHVDVKELDVDFLASSGYKWLLSPLATGFLYLRRELIEQIGLSILGYRSAEDMKNFAFREFKPADTARRFEHGQLNFPGFAGMREAIRMLKEVGIYRIEKRIKSLTSQIVENIREKKNLEIVSPLEPEYRSGILNIKCQNPDKTQAKMHKKRVILSVRQGGLRISPHFYNTPEEIQKFLIILSQSA